MRLSRRWGALRLPPPTPPYAKQKRKDCLAGGGEIDLLEVGKLTAPKMFGANLKLVGRLGAALALRALLFPAGLLLSVKNWRRARYWARKSLSKNDIPESIVCHPFIIAGISASIMGIMLRANTGKRFSLLTCTTQAPTMSNSLAHPCCTSGQRQTLNITPTT